MRPLALLAGTLALLLLAIPGIVLVRAATAPNFAWSGLAGEVECPVREGGTRCLSVVQAATHAGILAGCGLALAGLWRGARRRVVLGAGLLAGVAFGGVLARVALGAFVPDDVVASLPLVVVAGALAASAALPPRSPAAPA